MRALALSDTHGRHRHLSVPRAPLGIFAGDALDLFAASSDLDLWDQHQDFCAWLTTQPVERWVIVGGNHDLVYVHDRDRAVAMLPENASYLQDEAIEIDGLRIWGSPWQPEFMPNHAFTKPPGSAALHWIWSRLPADLDILVTHGPSLGFGDWNGRHHAGDRALSEAISLKQPRLHLFGHIHGDWQPVAEGPTAHHNVSSVDASWNLRQPVGLELDPPTAPTPPETLP